MRILDLLRREARDDAKDGWVASTWGDLPLLFAGPVVFFAGVACTAGGLVAFLRGEWGTGAVVLALGLLFLWLALQWTAGRRERRAERRLERRA